MLGPGISYSFGDYSLDLKRGALLKAGIDVKLRPKSFGVLRVLIERRGELLTKDELLNAVWGHVVVTDGALTQCLIDVRRAIGDESQQMIKTVPRRGYIFDVPVVVSDGVPAKNRPAVSGSASGVDERGPAPAQSACVRCGGALWWRSSFRWCPLPSGGVSIAAVRIWPAGRTRCCGAGPEQLHRRVAVRQHEQRPGQRVLLRRHLGGNPEPAGGLSRTPRDRENLLVRPEGQWL